MHQLRKRANSVVGLFTIGFRNRKVVSSLLPAVAFQVNEEVAQISPQRFAPFARELGPRESWYAKRPGAMTSQVALERFGALLREDRTVSTSVPTLRRLDSLRD